MPSFAAGRASITKAHRARAQACHPDRHCQDPRAAICGAAHRATVLINNARDELLQYLRSNAEPSRPPWEEPAPTPRQIKFCLFVYAWGTFLLWVLCRRSRPGRRLQPARSKARARRWWTLSIHVCSILSRRMQPLCLVAGIKLAVRWVHYGICALPAHGGRGGPSAALTRARRLVAEARGIFDGARGWWWWWPGVWAARSAVRVARLKRFWRIIIAARRTASLHKSRRVLAALCRLQDQTRSSCVQLCCTLLTVNLPLSNAIQSNSTPRTG